jgi:hypothetical protein
MDSSSKALNLRHHQQNIKLIEEGIKLMQKDIKLTYIREQEIVDESTVNWMQQKEVIKQNRIIYVRILSGLIVSWSEQLLKRLILEAGAFKPEQVDKFHQLQNSRHKWTTIFKLAFCNSYLPYDPVDPLFSNIREPESITSIRRSARDKYVSVLRVINEEIFPVIDLRNKVQHGEWKIAFDQPHSINRDTNLTAQVNRQNIRTLQTLIHDIQAIYKMIKDVATFRGGSFNLSSRATPFEYFYDKNFERIESNKKNLTTYPESQYRNEIVQRNFRGKAWRNLNANGATAS